MQGGAEAWFKDLSIETAFSEGLHTRERAYNLIVPATQFLRSVGSGRGLSQADFSTPRPENGPAHLSPFLPAMVRLLTHNLLACHVKGCSTNNFPLKLTNVKLALREADFNPDFLRGFLPRIEWDALIQASREVTG